MRIPLIDPVKALAAQIIVFHHMMFYSSMRGPLEEAFPTIVGFLADPARYAVQVFLVIGGFLSMQGLLRRLTPDSAGMARPFTPAELVDNLSGRYRRLVRPYALALLVACAALVWVQKIDPVIELTPAAPSQIMAHLLLIHSIADVPALSAGVWYVAIDFQLYAIGILAVAVALKLSGRQADRARQILLAILSLLTVSSLFFFNRQSDLDMYGLFFMGSYGLGMLAAWAVQARREQGAFLLAASLITLAQALHYRERLWVTLMAVAFLLLAPKVRQLPAWVDSRPGRFFQSSSYALFLVHYPLAIALFAVIDRLFLTDVTENLMAAALCWTVFMAGAWALMRAERWVYDEVPAHAARLFASVRLFSRPALRR